jgi:hypothetical protein
MKTQWSYGNDFRQRELSLVVSTTVTLNQVMSSLRLKISYTKCELFSKSKSTKYGKTMQWALAEIRKKCSLNVGINWDFTAYQNGV